MSLWGWAISSPLQGWMWDRWQSNKVFNQFTLRAAKRDLTILEIFSLQKHFFLNIWEGMLIRRQTTYLLQIFCEISLYFQVVFKSMKAADDIWRGTRECEWVNYCLCWIVSWQYVAVKKLIKWFLYLFLLSLLSYSYSHPQGHIII